MISSVKKPAVVAKMPTSAYFQQICMVLFVQRAEKMNTSANYLHS